MILDWSDFLCPNVSCVLITEVLNIKFGKIIDKMNLLQHQLFYLCCTLSTLKSDIIYPFFLSYNDGSEGSTLMK